MGTMPADEWKRRIYRVFDRAVPTVPFRFLPPKQSVRMAFNVILDREPDAVGGADYTQKLASGALSRHGVAEALAHSEEFRRRVPIGNVLLSMHVSRSDVRLGPAPRRPHPRPRRAPTRACPTVRSSTSAIPIPSSASWWSTSRSRSETRSTRAARRASRCSPSSGPVEFAFHSMVDLGRYEDGSFDLVYSGQSIEHVTEAQGEQVAREAFRVLAPGGWLCLDTPNGPRVAAALGRADEPRPQDRVQRGPAGGAPRARRLRRQRVQGLEPDAARGWRRGCSTRRRRARTRASSPPAEDCLLLAVVARKPG